MAVICPTVTPLSINDYHQQLERITKFTKRIHIDCMDGKFAPTKSPSLKHLSWPKNIDVDIHLMYEHPEDEITQLIQLKPKLVILHAEAGGNFVTMANDLHEANIRVGVALLPKTPVDVIKPALEITDYVLIFSGDLGHFGGSPNLVLLDKVKKAKQMKPEVEIGWDGGIGDTVVKPLVEAGVDVLNVGGYIQKAENPAERYDILKNLLN